MYPTLHLNFFFCLKISLTFISVVTHAHHVKESYNQVENSNTCGVFNEVLTICVIF